MINASVREGFHFAAQLPHGGNVTINPFFWNGSGKIDARTNPHATVTTVILEPGTLGLLGTGLIGLAGMTRRKRKLRKVNPDLVTVVCIWLTKCPVGKRQGFSLCGL